MEGNLNTERVSLFRPASIMLPLAYRTTTTMITITTWSVSLTYLTGRCCTVVR